jgi:energy-coupling factor transporter ATP-binding protein EcfA2
MAGFVKATRKQRKLRMALLGPTGSGKTYSALMLARGVVGPSGRIALIDTENYSASLYADVADFDVLNLTNFGPADYVDAIEQAEKAGYDAVVIDSLSHAWIGIGGALDQVDKAQAKSEAAGRTANSFTAWRNITPQHNRMVDKLVRANLHIIVTMRVKMEFVQEKDERGKTIVRKVGLQPVQRDGLEYEFDVVGDMSDATLNVTKTRCSLFHDAVIIKPGQKEGAKLADWLNSGEAAPALGPAPVFPPAPAPSAARQRFGERFTEVQKASGIERDVLTATLFAQSGITRPEKGKYLTDEQYDELTALLDQAKVTPVEEAAQ